MWSNKLLCRKIIFLVIVAMSASYAGAFSLPDTGQTTCYDATLSSIPCAGTGQDAAYTLHPPSYTDHINGTVTDNNTGLMWQKNTSALSWSWSPAVDECNNQTLAGYTDWRLPSRKELMTIANFSNTTPLINTTFFPIGSQQYYWTSTSSAAFPDRAWYLYFISGAPLASWSAKADSTFHFYVRCVRGTQTSQSLVDNGDQTVTDNATGLIWQKGEGGFMGWYTAISYCEGLSLANQQDWRLPNVKELESLNDEAIYSPSINPLFSGAQAYDYWSSTTVGGLPGKAWTVNFDSGGVFNDGNKSLNSNYVRCVRGGQTSDLSVVMTDSPDPVEKGQQITYDTTVTNNGPDTAESVVLEETLPSGAVFVSAAASQGACSQLSGVVTCDIGSMASSDIVTVTVVATAPNTGGSATNTAEVFSSSGDPDLLNNVAAAQTLVHSVGVGTITPNALISQTGIRQVFSAVYTDNVDYTFIKAAEFLINGGLNGANAIKLTYNRAANKLYLYNDAGSAVVGSCTPGVAGTLQNTQGILDCGATTVTAVGTDLTINWSITPKAGGMGYKNMFMKATDNSNANTGWQPKGTWTVTSASNIAPAVVSLTPSTLVSAPASVQLLTGVFRDMDGVADLKTMELLINASLSSVNGIRISYSKSVNKLYLYNDAGSAVVGSCTPGVAGTLQNAQGILDCGTSTVSSAGTDQTVNLKITPNAAFEGAKKVYMQAIDNSSAATGWIQKGTWTVKSANTAPTVVSVAPSAPTTAVNVAQTFTAVYRDSDGGGNHKASDIVVNGSLSTVNGIYADYNRSMNKLYLYNDAGTATVGSCTPGVAGTIQNTQGMLDCGATTITENGTDITVNWSLTARIGFTGAKKVYLKAADHSNATSGWIQKGTWSIQ